MIRKAFMVLALVLAACGGGSDGDRTTGSGDGAADVTSPSGLTPGTSGAVGGTAPGGTGTLGEPACETDDAPIVIKASFFEFNRDCIATAADAPFEIVFENASQTETHNVAISRMDNSPVFKGDVIDGGETATYAIDALPAGDYRYFCEIHPAQMQGTLVVR